MKTQTFFLKIALILIGSPILALCVCILPSIIDEAQRLSYLLFMGLIMYVAAIPFFIALLQAYKLLKYIDDNIAFSELSVKTLNNIKKCSMVITILFTLNMPLLAILAQKDDAPGIVLIGLMIIFVSIVISFFAALLQKLLKNAIDIKSENDLTV